jgi:hypothetical protein
MRSIQARFQNMSEKYPDVNSLINFGRAIWSQKFSRPMIKYWFNLLVEKDDYDPKDKIKLLRHFYKATENQEKKFWM